MKRVIVAVAFATVMVAVYVAIIYAFFAYLWPILPSWAVMIAFIALAVFVIGSPIFWLMRLSEKVPVPERLLRRDSSERDEQPKP
jgi:hypothetical protein